MPRVIAHDLDPAKVAHTGLTRTYRLSETVPAFSPMWKRMHRAAIRRWGEQTVVTQLHGAPLEINFANPYPFTVARHPQYNAPQVEAVAATSKALGRAVVAVDVGAAVGDTALLLFSRLDARVLDELLCVEGDARFATLLRRNLAGRRATVFEAMLSDEPGLVGGLERTEHAGTASAVGAEAVAATTLDALFGDRRVDVVKVDTDGFDGRIIAGGRRLLAEQRPTVLFEWHPELCRKAGTDPMQAFEVLQAAGYRRFTWFTKFGGFSHFGTAELERLAELCQSARNLHDWHYDVIALHQASAVDDLAVADLRTWFADAGHR